MWRVDAIKKLCDQAIEEYDKLEEEDGALSFELEQGRAELATEILEILKGAKE